MARLINVSVIYVVLFCVFYCTHSSTVEPTSNVKPVTTTPSTTTAPSTPSTTLTPEEECGKHNGSCSDCVGAAGAKCLYCYEDDKCKLYPVKKIIPDSSVCSLSKARWSVCWLNFEAMLISVGVVGGIIVMVITCCCVYCCCCRGGDTKKWDKEDGKWERQKKDRKEKSNERKMERKDRLDEIRRKYGLVKENNDYERFDA